MSANYDDAIRLVIHAKYGYGNNIDNLKQAMLHIQNEIGNLEGRPDPNQLDLLNQGENNVQEK
jgi:hypothetical protein